MCRIIAIANQKGGVGKTTTCVNLGIGLARAGKKVLLVEADAQGSMAVSLGIQEPDELDVTRMTPKNKNNRVVGGIEYNSYNKPIGYFFRQYEIDGFTMAEPI